MAREINTLIIGGGLAGTTLTWALRHAGVDVLLVDRNETSTSSKVAAGLISPVTGKRLAQLDDFEVLWSTAKRFYRQIESITNSRLLTETPLLRLFHAKEHVEKVRKRIATGWDVQWIESPKPFQTDLGSVEIPVAGRLDALQYLDVSHRHFQTQNHIVHADLHPLWDVKISSEQIEIPKIDVTAQRVVFCQGFTGAYNPYFGRLLCNPAKGQILTVRIPGLDEDRIVQHGVWLIRIQDDVYKVGSTYEHDDLSSTVTAEGRDAVLAKLNEILPREVELLRHEAGVRPVLLQQVARVGTHPADGRIGYLNGLGSKGSLQGPYLAEMMVEHLLHGKPIERRYDVRREAAFADTTVKSLEVENLTHVAQEFVSRILKPDEFAIDGTAGNGYDTQFLAECVGKKGHVWAFDRQQQALDSTSGRLTVAGIKHVTLINDCHSNVVSHLPGELRGSIGAAMFNLGYLPGCEKSVITTSETTERALRDVMSLLRPGGILTVLAYVGHPGGLDEEAVVRRLWKSLPPREFTINLGYADPPSPKSPRLFVVRRRLT
ncbi:tRNA 5-(aminomethyl)-2-thiouridylate-methyltransferase MnmM [Lacunimicrobium album]